MSDDKSIAEAPAKKEPTAAEIAEMQRKEAADERIKESTLNFIKNIAGTSDDDDMRVQDHQSSWSRKNGWHMN